MSNFDIKKTRLQLGLFSQAEAAAELRMPFVYQTHNKMNKNAQYDVYKK